MTVKDRVTFGNNENVPKLTVVIDGQFCTYTKATVLYIMKIISQESC